MKKLSVLVLSMAILAGCTSSKTSEDKTTTAAPETIEATVAVVEPIAEVEYSKPEPVSVSAKTETPTSTYTTTSNSSSSSSSYYYDDEEEEDDYWEETRKHSPNDNFLVGFDEDVDDVHDMEIYMEGY